MMVSRGAAHFTTHKFRAQALPGKPSGIATTVMHRSTLESESYRESENAFVLNELIDTAKVPPAHESRPSMPPPFKW